ncbi:MAG: NAD+ synthase [Candidatus Aenigmatarchaeota archaeon]
MDCQKTEDRIIEFVRRKAVESGANGVVIGLSGGIDSSLTAKICAEALGRDRVLGLLMPSDKSQDADDATEFAKSIGIAYKIVDISDTVSVLRENLDSAQDKIVLGNMLPRLRMLVLYYYANMMKRLVVGTGNKSEILTGYFTKYGDGACDLLPIGDLYKTEVIELAEFMSLPEKIIQKRPTPGLWEGQIAEEELGISYDELDKILYRLFELKESQKKISEKTGITAEKIGKIRERCEGNEHKLKTPEICKIGSQF